MPEDYEIESQGDHQFVVRLEDQGETVETWFRLTPEALDKLETDDEEDVVRRTVTFLSRHQDIADFPDIVEIEDVISSYDDYVEYMTS
jgi:hypothetical protein